MIVEGGGVAVVSNFKTPACLHAFWVVEVIVIQLLKKHASMLGTRELQVKGVCNVGARGFSLPRSQECPHTFDIKFSWRPGSLLDSL